MSALALLLLSLLVAGGAATGLLALRARGLRVSQWEIAILAVALAVIVITLIAAVVALQRLQA